MSRMIHFCVLSCRVVGFMRICTTMDSTMTKGSGLTGISQEPRGMVATVSIWDKSVTQPIHGALRNSAAACSTQKKAKKMGICASIGRQPPTGEMPYSRYSFIISALTRWRSSPYFSCSSFILGCSRLMRFMLM